jgi:hypothetical protein
MNEKEMKLEIGIKTLNQKPSVFKKPPKNLTKRRFEHADQSRDDTCHPPPEATPLH